MAGSEEGIEITPPPAELVLPGRPEVGIRQYFMSEHLWNARHMVGLCKERESALAAEGFRGIDRAVRSFALAAILESVAFVEAVVNSVWQDVADAEPGAGVSDARLAGLSDAAVRRMGELWSVHGPELPHSLLHLATMTRTSTIRGDSVRATFAGGAPLRRSPSAADGGISPCAAGPVIVAHAAPLAQLVEQLTLNQRVRGSKP
jgi:hypothetical protein